MDLPLSAGRIVISVSALSSCRALNSPLVVLLAGLFGILMHLVNSALRLWALGADRCLLESNVHQACWNCHCSAVSIMFLLRINNLWINKLRKEIFYFQL